MSVWADGVDGDVTVGNGTRGLLDPPPEKAGVSERGEQQTARTIEPLYPLKYPVFGVWYRTMAAEHWY